MIVDRRTPGGGVESTEKFFFFGQRCPMFHPTSVHCRGKHFVHCKDHINYAIEISDSFKGPMWPDTGDFDENVEIVLSHQDVVQSNNSRGQQDTDQSYSRGGVVAVVDGKVIRNDLLMELMDKNHGVHWMVPKPDAVPDGNNCAQVDFVLGSDPPDGVDPSTMKECSILYIMPCKKMPPQFDRQLNPIIYLNPMSLVPPANGWPK